MSATDARRQRIADLLKARRSIDAQIARLGGDVAEFIENPGDPRARASVQRWAEMARSLVWEGRTHAEVAIEFAIPVTAVDALVARAAEVPLVARRVRAA